MHSVRILCIFIKFPRLPVKQKHKNNETISSPISIQWNCIEQNNVKLSIGKQGNYLEQKNLNFF